MSIELTDRGAGRSRYQLDTNRMAGFEQAVRNNQTHLALLHLVDIVHEQALEIADLKGRLPSPVETTVLEEPSALVEEESLLPTKPTRARKKTTEVE